MRNTYLDTTKAILIFLVVLGHFLERMIGWGSEQGHVLLGSIYFVHMPAFIFVSGVLFKDKNWLKNIIFFFSLYLPFQFIFPAFDAIWTGRYQLNGLERPYWILWYLWGMMVWTLLTHFLIKTRWAIFTSLILALCIGLSPWNNYQYSIGRIFTFFPFFMAGHLYGNKIIQFIQNYKYASSLSILIVFFIGTLVFYTHINQFWLYGSLSYRQLHVSVLDGTWMRLGIMLLSSLGIFSIFGLAKLFKNHFILLGVNTLPVYLLHAFVVIFLSKYWQLHFNIFVNVLICLVLSILTCFILQQSLFDQLLRKLSLWLMKPTEKLWKRSN